jgi:hypothetical protein
MKKVSGSFFLGIILLALGIGGIQAQDWSWENPIPIELSPKLVQIAADPTTGDIFGVDTSGSVKRDFASAAPITGSPSTLSGGEGRDIAADLNGQVYLCTEGEIKRYDPSSQNSEALDQQPLLPPAPDDTGKYISITVGRGGTLFVLYEASSGNQYLLTGNPPPASEGVVIRFSPRTLNLSSRGNWVTCSIDLPEGTDEHDIDLSTVKIVNISVQNPVINAAAEIPIASNSPSTVTSGKGKLKVKFPRYDKNQPDNPLSLVGKLREVLNGNSNGFYQVSLTVEGELSTTGEKFTGTDEILVQLRN